MPTTLFAGQTTLKVRALFLGERIDLRLLEIADRLGTFPLTVAAGDRGCAVLFRYGVVVLFDLSPVEEAAFLNYLRPLISEPFPSPEREETEIRLAPHEDESVDGTMVQLQEPAIPRLQTVADILAKSVVLGYYETSLAEVFERIEPVAASLQRGESGKQQGRELLRYIGGALSTQHRMVGLVQVSEKPEILWEQPDLERLYLRLEDEYELSERHRALERKLQYIARTAETILNLLQHSTTLRVEWYVVALIVIEVLLSVYENFLKP